MSTKRYVVTMEPFTVDVDNQAQLIALLSRLMSEEPFELNNKLAEAACQNCDWGGRIVETCAIKDIFERVEPGEPMPAGECPRCGALCTFQKEENDESVS